MEQAKKEKMQFLLRKGGSLELDNEDLDEVESRLRKKNEDYASRYGLKRDALALDRATRTVRAQDYFGELELPSGKVVRSNGDYLREYEEKEVYLEDRDLEGLDHINAHETKIEIKRSPRGEPLKTGKGAVVLKATSYVGVVSLASGLRLQIVPKISNTALYYILSFLYDVKVLDHHAETTFPKGSFFLDLIALLFEAELKDVLQQGLLKKYVGFEENLNYLRGKLLVGRQIRHNFISRQKFYCDYDELTYDNPENQTVLYALSILQLLVISEGLWQELNELGRILEKEVTPRKFIGAEEAERITFSKLNAYYSKLIELSKLVIREVYVDDIGSPEARAFGFLVDMNSLFQNFMHKLLEKKLAPEYEVIPEKKRFNSLLESLGDAPKIVLKPDILIKKADKPVAVVDAKYKELDYRSDSEGVAKSSDVYQITTYTLAFKCPGILLYAETRGHISHKYKITEVEGKRIHVITVDIRADEKLSESGFKEFINRSAASVEKEIKTALEPQ